MATSSRSLTVATGAMPSTAKVPHVYQIDFTAVASGKRVASTKRRVRWRFGFANPEALAAGETGTACRGEEHDVTLVWSITSGKRLILADGQEVHYSNSRSGVFDHTWTMRGNHVLKVVAHASPPLSPTPGFRQYDFFVDGQTFFSFPKVYRLGLAPNDPRNAVSPSSPVRLADRAESSYSGRRNKNKSGIASLEAPHNMDEEEAYLQEAIKNSLQENKKKAEAKQAPSISAAGQSLLLDFLEEEQAPVAHAASNPHLPAGAPTDTDLLLLRKPLRPCLHSRPPLMVTLQLRPKPAMLLLELVAVTVYLVQWCLMELLEEPPISKLILVLPLLSSMESLPLLPSQAMGSRDRLMPQRLCKQLPPQLPPWPRPLPRL